jgi:imidazole glycerol-phosphate synthase subunit HisH
MKSTVAIVRYNAGNVQSLLYALGRIGCIPILTDDPDTLMRADKVIFPGVGEARSSMVYLRERGLDTVIANLTQPVLGICIGMQLLCEYSEEHDTSCIGVLPASVRRFPSGLALEQHCKIPHIGWNTLDITAEHPLFTNVPSHSFVYYVHSYAANIISGTIATTTYIQPFSSALRNRNFSAVQFHPEKSGIVGEQILRNFLAM